MRKWHVLALVFICLNFYCAKEPEKQTDKIHEDKPKLILAIEKRDYKDGNLEIIGTARNVGKGYADNPEIIVEVCDTAGKKVFVKETTSPAGYKGGSMAPGASAAFHFKLTVPEKPDDVICRFGVPGINFEVQ